MQIRRVKKLDLKELGELYADAYNGSGYEWDDKQAIKLMKKFFQSQKDLFYLVEDEELGIIGGVWGDILHHSSGEFLSSVDIWVDPEYQNRGVGKQMLRHLIEQARKKYKIVFIEFHSDSEKDFPYSYYKRLGFEESSWVNLAGDPDEVLKRIK